MTDQTGIAWLRDCGSVIGPAGGISISDSVKFPCGYSEMHSHTPHTVARTRSQRPKEAKETPRSRAPGCPYHQVPLHLNCSEQQPKRGLFQKSDILGKSIIATMARLEGIKNRHPVMYIKIPSEHKLLQPLKLNLIAYFQRLKCQEPQAEVVLEMVKGVLRKQPRSTIVGSDW